MLYLKRRTLVAVLQMFTRGLYYSFAKVLDRLATHGNIVLTTKRRTQPITSITTVNQCLQSTEYRDVTCLQCVQPEQSVVVFLPRHSAMHKVDEA